MEYREGEIIEILGKNHIIINGKPTPIEFKDPGKFSIDALSNKEWFFLEKLRIKETHKEFASKDAMVVGCYIFLEIFELHPEHPSDKPMRFIARVMYKSKPEKDYFDADDEAFETIVRINPLLNSVSKGNVMDLAKGKGGWFNKDLKTFEDVFLNKEICLSKIDLALSPDDDKKSYAYHWDVTGIVKQG